MSEENEIFIADYVWISSGEHNYCWDVVELGFYVLFHLKIALTTNEALLVNYHLDAYRYARYGDYGKEL